LDDDAAYDDPSDPATCLAQAVYYEARSESLAGQRGVAQVVMNRTRVGVFPSSVCGVVYQRATDTSGCQFSFVCDGSMYRPLDWTAWERARSVAAQALAGFVYKPLLNATHYHAAWMTPYWSYRLARIRQIGGHIFYR
jgi:spore germination cell wall hydrolase CwlJ-like protein